MAEVPAPDPKTPAVRSAGTGPEGGFPVIAPELAALAQNGAAVSVASCAADGAPIVGMGAGVVIAPDGMVRVVLDRSANARLIAAVVGGGAVAVTFTGAPDHTSFQVKASGARYVDSCPDDRAEIERQGTLLAEGLVELGFSMDQATGYAACDPENCGVILLRPERVFSQTPGPGAGAELPR